MAKEIKYNVEARELLKEGVDALSNAVKVTLGLNELDHPVIFDPVGAGAAHRRNAVLENLMDHIRFTVIRGNISEIKYVGDKSSHAKGVDAANEDLANEDNIYEIAEYAKKISAITCSVIAISGPIDVVANADTAYLIRNGHPMMSRITGTGCMLSSAIGVFVSANPYKALEATVTAMAAYGYAGELAYEKTVRTDFPRLPHPKS